MAETGPWYSEGGCRDAAREEGKEEIRGEDFPPP
jgi:hypothetical protein